MRRTVLPQFYRLGADAPGAAPPGPLPPGQALAVEPGPPAPRFWREYYIYSADFTGAQALAAGTADALPASLVFSSVFSIMLQIDAPFEIRRTMYQATDPRVYVRMQDTASGRYLHRDTIDLRGLGGQGYTSGMPSRTAAFLAYEWPDPEILSAATTVNVYAADFSGATNTVRISYHGAKLRQGYDPAKFYEDGSPRVFRDELSFVYALPNDNNYIAVGASATVDLVATTDIEADFVCDALVGTFQGACTVTLDDGGTDRQWMDRAVDIRNLVGNGLFPNYLPAPRYIRRGAAIHARVTDTSASSNAVRLYLIGRKLYDAKR